MTLTLALLARRKKPLSAVVAEVPSYAIVKRKVELAGSGITVTVVV